MLFQDWVHHHHHCQPKPQTTVTADKMHIRKPSSSDSVSSLSSASTTTSASPSPTRSHHRQHSRIIEFDPLSLNPTHQAPPRLSERPFKHLDHEQLPQPQNQQPTRELQLPPVASPSINNHDRSEEAPPAAEYFNLKLELLRRPTLQRSHWSESTIQTLDVEERGCGDEQDFEDESSVAATPTPPQLYQERLVRPTEQWQNFSYKRNTVPRRPPMTNGDSIENYIKRGGWKRRGIVFQPNEGGAENNDTDRYSAHTVI